MTAVPHRRAFTLLELATVLAIIGILVSVAVPTFSVSLARSRTVEARSLLEAMAHAELTYFRDHGAYLPCPPSPTTVPLGATAWSGGPAWDALGVRVAGAVRYQYEIKVDGSTFHIEARADLDGDGKTSLFLLDGETLGVNTTDELE